MYLRDEERKGELLVVCKTLKLRTEKMLHGHVPLCAGSIHRLSHGYTFCTDMNPVDKKEMNE